MLTSIASKAEMDRVLRELKPGLMQLDDMCLNGEAEVAALQHAVTPFSSVFVRCNGDVPVWPQEARDDWRLRIDGLVERSLDMTLGDLKSAFRMHSITAVIECAGNGRALLDPPAEGLQWQHGAVACATWTGIRLGDLLRAAGASPGALHVGFESPDCQIGKPGMPAFSRGFSLQKALADETMLAFEMNGEPLHMLHGGPLRVVAPGYPGAAWQKWLSRIIIRDREHDGPKMTGLDYRIDGKVIEDMPVKSLITQPLKGFQLSKGEKLLVTGYAWAGHTPVASVDVSGDGGQTWVQASLDAGAGPFAWRRFSGLLTPRDDQSVEIVARATDASGKSQPLGNAPWNQKGYCNNAVHRVTPAP